MPRGDLVLPCLMSLKAPGESPMVFPRTVSDQPRLSRSRMIDFQFMGRNLRHSVICCQRPSVTELRFNSRMKTIGERVRAEREAKNWSRKQLSKATKVPETTISDLELGYTKKSTSLHILAKALGVGVEWLETGKGHKHTIENDEEWRVITDWKQPLAAGDGSEPLEFSESDKLKFNAVSLQEHGLNSQHLSIFHASGDSMNPRIHDGDHLLLDNSQTKPQDDKIFAVNYDGQLYVKRLRKFGKQWFLVSDNAIGKWKDPIPVDDSKLFSIIGRVRWIGSWED